jgi:hypothetical protein
MADVPSGPSLDSTPHYKKKREEHRLRVFENRVLRRIFGPKRSDRSLKKIAQ